MGESCLWVARVCAWAQRNGVVDLSRRLHHFSLGVRLFEMGAGMETLTHLFTYMCM